jgi:holo-[acyl-carrier protein] synthase
MIYGIGTDLGDISRIERSIQKWGDRFITKVYCSDEANYCGKKAFPPMHFAAGFAVKESFLKSFGIGLGMGVNLRDVELVHNEQGAPSIRAHNRAYEAIIKAGIKAVHVTVTHTKKYASAFVILEK